MNQKRTQTRKGPVVLETDLLDVSPQDAPPVPELVEPEGRAMQKVTMLAARKSSWISKVFWTGISGIFGMVLSVAAFDFVEGLFARNVYLGQAATGLFAVIGVVLLLVILREIFAFLRLSRVDTLREKVKDALEDGQRPRAQGIVSAISSFYAGREELRWARQSLSESEEDIFDGPDLIAHAERTLMEPLDRAAEVEIQLAARNVAAATALLPLAFADVAVALTANVRMVRRIAEVYGGRAGTFGSWRLLRAVATHLLATGAVAVGDDLIGSVAGGGALAKVSRRFGEGVINGALTARVGVAAMEVCRPMPFMARKRPSISGLLKTALVGLFK